MSFLKNRTVVGVICILLSLLICFGLTPLFNQSVSQKAEIVRVVQPIRAGDEITESMVQIVEVGGYNLPEDVLRQKESAVGKYATADLAVGDYIIPSKLSDAPAAENAYLYSLDGSQQAISVSIKSFAEGLSGKLQSGDIVSVIAPDYKQQGQTVVPAELQYVEIISVTASSGYDANTGEPVDEEDDKELPDTVTLLVSPEQAKVLAELEAEEGKLAARIQEIMYTIPQMIDPSVPIGPDDTYNVEAQRFGEPVVPDFPIPYHTEIMESFDGIDMDAAGRVAGNGFYYLLGNIARLHEAVLAYARDFMINKGFTYVIPPFMMHGNVVQGVMSFPEMDAMMYKIEGEDLYLIGTSEHTMIGRFIDQTLDESKMPLTLTSYSPCFRKEKGAHGIEERGIYRIHQFEKQEMIVVCRPEESADWYEKLWQMSVELFRSMEIPVRQLNCCSGDLADLKVKSCDIEAWSPRQQKYFEVCSCSNLGDAQARRLHIRIKGKDGKTYLAHTLNNTCVAPPRMLIAFLENHLQADGTVTIPLTLGSWTLEFPEQGLALLALIPIWLYNGRQGAHNKAIQYACYAFYPAHMLILALLRMYL